MRVLHLLAASVSVFLVAVSPARADFGSSKAWFLSLDSEVRLNIQSELVLVGDYDALLDGTFGSSTYTGLTRYQARHSQVADGVLSPDELSGLLSDARAVYGQLGIGQIDDTAAGVSIYLPTSLFTDKKSIQNGNAYSSDDGQIELDTYGQTHASESFAAIFAGLNTTTADRSITYSTLGSDSFVVTGRDSDGFFYDRFYDDGASTVGFELRWTGRYQKVGTMLSIFMASFSYPVAKSAVAAAPGGSSPPTQNQGLTGDQTQYFSGSGFFFNEYGMIVTNFHVVNHCALITVPGYGNAQILRGDPSVDLAVIQVSPEGASDATPATIRVKPPALAESVLLMGYPLADILNSSLNVSTGLVSSETGMSDQPNWFTTNAGIEPGNSGGPLLDQQGNVIGVAVAKIDDAKLLASAGTSAPNVGFAIKNTVLLDFLSTFVFNSVSDDNDGPAKSPQEISNLAKNFTVQIICEAQPSVPPASPAAAAAPPPVPTPSNRLAIYGGLDFYGNDIFKGRTKDAVECAVDCQRDQQCRAFTYNADPSIHSGPNCFLKGDVNRLEAYSSAISGLFLGPHETAQNYSFDAIDPTRDLLIGQDLTGEDLSSSPYASAETLDRCRMACIDNRSCAAFSYVAAAKQCWLKGGTSVARSAPGVVSGQKRQVSFAPSDVFNVAR